MNVFTSLALKVKLSTSSKEVNSSFAVLLNTCNPIFYKCMAGVKYENREDVLQFCKMYAWEMLNSFDHTKGEFNTFLQSNLKLSVRAYIRDNETLIRITERGIIDSKKEETTFAGQSAKNASTIASLNVENDEGDSLIDSIKDSGILPDQQIIIKDNRNMIVKALMSLSKSERKAFWLTVHSDLSLREAGIKMNMSHERVNQLKKKAISKIAKMQLV